MFSLLLVLFGISAISSYNIDIGQRQPCPSGWVYTNYTEQCFYFSGKITASQYSASLNCQNYEGGNLVSILSQNDYDIVYNMTRDSIYTPWIGLQTDEYGIPTWIDGYSYNFTKFSNISKVTLDHKQCFGLRTLQPSDGYISLNCNYAQPFVCKQHASNCPSTYYNGTSGDIVSSNYPNNYYNNLNCIYHINVTKNYHISFKFLHFDVENNYDYVEIYDGPDINSNLIGNFTGNITNVNAIKSSGNTLTIRFKTDNIVSKRGWYAHYSRVDQINVIELSGPGGRLTSPNFPENYDYLISQYYKFSTPNNTVVRFTFNTFLTEPINDYLTIYDGPTDRFPIIANISGELVNPPTNPLVYRSSTNNVYMFFYTNLFIEYKGWDLTWHTEYIQL